VFFASFTYQAQSWTRLRRVVAKVEWHQGELYPRVGFIVTNLTRPAERISKFYGILPASLRTVKRGRNQPERGPLGARPPSRDSHANGSLTGAPSNESRASARPVRKGARAATSRSPARR
jgi:hypothetical protein